MRTIRLLFLAIVTLAGASAYAADSVCDYYVPACKDKYTRYNTETAIITQEAAAKKITTPEAGKRVAQIARSMYPNDPLLISITEQQQAMAEILGKLPVQQQKTLEDAAAKTFARALKERFVLFDTMAEMSGQQQANQQAAAQYQQSSDAQANNARSTIATAMFLNGVGRAFATSWGQSILPTPQICTYYGGTSYCQ